MLLKEIGVSTRHQNAFAKKNIYTTNDLVQYFPKRYHDYQKMQLIKDAIPDRYGAFNGELIFCDKRMGKKWYMVMRIRQDDGTDIGIVMFSETFRYKEFTNLLHKRVVIYGKPEYDTKYGWSVKYPENLMPEEKFVSHIEPVYTKIEGISDQAFYEHMNKCIDMAKEPLDVRLLRKTGMQEYKQSLINVHYPKTSMDLAGAKRRLLFNDMLYFAEALGKSETHGTEKTNIILKKFEKIIELSNLLPFDLTDDQKKVINTFVKKTKSGDRFNALIQGDVGCGKTLVAIAMIACACENGYQAVLMAPREVLAKQHYEEVKGYAEKLGFRCDFLSSSLTAKEKKQAIESIESGETQIIVGTHSCIADSVKYKNLGIVITDEEHLFGVKQKEALEKKSDEGVHAVSMSATPIPRSLATILYGNKKEIMTIKTMPKGRLPVKTAKQRGHASAFKFMKEEVRKGHQCYVVCPAIEENEEYEIVSIEAMEQEYRAYFEPRGITIGVVHGKMDEKDVSETIKQFSSGSLDILMSTTVIEVGVNVPNATVMVVEQAERFGLASLHQLRGRVGRSDVQSYCILISKDQSNARLDTMVHTTDGLVIAEADLAQRGSGDLLGVRQAGNNRFVNEMLKRPEMFQKAIEVIKLSKENGYENHLENIYGEYAESVGEDA